MADEASGVVITVRDIYEGVNKLTSEVQSLVYEIRTSKQTGDDHERRLRTLERWMYAIPASLLVAIASAVMTVWKG